MRQARAVVIGGGIVGASALYHLTQLGWRDVVLLERDELTAGSTWHAAGNCPNFSTSWSIMQLQRYSTALYRRLAAESGGGLSYHVTGSIRLAQGRERLLEYRHVAAMAEAQGLDFAVLRPAELVERYPFLERQGLEGGLWDPLDGDIDPSQATQVLAAAARAAGATILRRAPVTAIRRQGDEWRLSTPEEEIAAAVVINAAGYRAGEVGRLVGLALPIVSLQHQYLVTEGLAEFAAREGKLPLLRDPDDSYYLRQERDGLLLGPYETAGAKAVWLDGIPADFVADLFPDEIERLEPWIAKAVARVPLLGQAGVKRVVNGPIPYTPDGNPLIGPAYAPGLDLRGFYLCCAFSFGVVQAGGAGKSIAEIVVEGEPEWELWGLDPRRFTGHATQAYTAVKALEVYENEYAAAFPGREWPAARPIRTSPLYEDLAARGAVFGARNGWERALWFRPAGYAGTTEVESFLRPPWFAVVRAEALAVRQRVGLIDLPGFAKFLVRGPEAAAALDRLLATPLPPVGETRLSYGLSEKGGILVESSISRLAEDSFYLASAAAAEWHDAAWLETGLRETAATIEPLTDRWGTLVLAGPAARKLLARLVQEDLSDERFPWRQARWVELDGARALLLRFGYTGELGYELHLPLEAARGVYHRLLAAGEDLGLAEVGLLALDSLRLEKGYAAWKAELETAVTPIEAGLERLVAWKKSAFVGREALLARRAEGPRQTLALLRLAEGPADAPPLSVVWHGEERVGLVTSGGYGHAVDASLALALLRTDVASEGTALIVEVLGERRAAEVVPRPLYDPANRRMKG